jgi:hypothetical protein
METIKDFTLDHSKYRHNYIKEHINELRIRAQVNERLNIIKNFGVNTSQIMITTRIKEVTIRSFCPE